MKLREFFDLKEAEEEDPSSGVPEPIDSDAFQRTTPFKTSAYKNQPGAGPISTGVPEPLDGGSSGPFFNPKAKGSPAPGRAMGGSKTEPLMNWQPPPGAFTSSPAPSPKRPVSSPSTMGLRQVGPRAKTVQIPKSAPQAAAQAVHPWAAGTPSNGVPEPIDDEGDGLSEFFSLHEMPRPKGSLGAPIRTMLDWASRQSGEFSMRDLFRTWRNAGGQPGQPDDKKAYLSFQTSVRPFMARSRNEISKEQPLLMIQGGTRGAQGTPAFFRWVGSSAGSAIARSPSEPDEFDQEDPTEPDGQITTAPQKIAQSQPVPDDSVDAAMDEPEQDRPAGVPEWIPLPDSEGAGANYAMYVLDKDLKMGPANKIWRDIARANSSLEAFNILRQTGPQNNQKKLRVAQQIFQNLGKTWD